MATADTTLVFVHGSGDSAQVWEPLIALLPEYHTVALDLPGHGALASQPGPQSMSVADSAAFVLSEMSRRDLERPMLIGHSLGGAIALRVALDAPERVGRLGLLGTGARLRVAPAFLEAAREADVSGVWAVTQASYAAQHESDAQAFHARRAPTAPGALFRDLSACNAFDAMGDVGRISQPALVIVGEDDRMTPPKFSAYLADQIPTSTLVVVPDAGHYVQVEQPQRVADALRTWLGA